MKYTFTTAAIAASIICDQR